MAQPSATVRGGYAYCEKLESILYEGLSLRIPIIRLLVFMRFSVALSVNCQNCEIRRLLPHFKM